MTSAEFQAAYLALLKRHNAGELSESEFLEARRRLRAQYDGEGA